MGSSLAQYQDKDGNALIAEVRVGKVVAAAHVSTDSIKSTGEARVISSNFGSTMTPPFHRLLSFYSNRSNYPDTQTIRLQDSIRGNLALGLDFPAALCIAIGRHLWLRNTSIFSLNIHVPSVNIKTTPLEGIEIDEKKGYTCSEIVKMGRQNGIEGGLDALGLWALAADVKTDVLAGEDVVGFQTGSLFERIEKRRKGTEQILPFWRGGPISAVGHSWVVKRVFNVDVYQSDYKNA